MSTSSAQAIATTIREQLFTRRQLVWCWGVPAKSWLALPENLEGENVSLGALRFDFTNCRKIKKGKVTISLNGLDLYDITFQKPVRNRVPHAFFPNEFPKKYQVEITYETVKEFNNVYAEDLHEIIDTTIGG